MLSGETSHARLFRLRYRLTEVDLYGDDSGYAAFLRREPRAVRLLRNKLRRRDAWEVDPLMPARSVNALAQDLSDGPEPNWAVRWDGDDLLLLEYQGARRLVRAEHRMRRNDAGLYPVGGVPRVGQYIHWKWCEVVPPWPGDPVDAAAIVSLLEAGSPNNYPLVQRIKDRAGTSEIAGAFALTKNEATLRTLCLILHDRRVRGRRDSSPAVPALLKLLDHPKLSVCQHAAEALDGIAGAEGGAAVRAAAPDAAARILQQLRCESDGACVAYLAGALGPLEHHAAVPDLIGLLEHDYWEARASAAWSLGHLRASEAAPPLQRALEREPLAQVRKAISDALHALSRTDS